MPQISRVTLFKVPNPEHQKLLLDKYRTMKQDALKDGKPYILSLEAGSTFDDQRRQGYTIAVTSQFASMEDMQYYDHGCETHKRLKEFAAPIRDGLPLVLYFEPAVTS